MMKIYYFDKLPVHRRANIFVTLWKYKQKKNPRPGCENRTVWPPQCKEENFSSTVFSVYHAFQRLAARLKRQHFNRLQGSSFLWLSQTSHASWSVQIQTLQYCSSTSLANNRDGSSKWWTDLWLTRFLSGWSFGRCGDHETKAGTTTLSYSE